MKERKINPVTCPHMDSIIGKSWLAKVDKDSLECERCHIILKVPSDDLVKKAIKSLAEVKKGGKEQ